MKKKIFNLVLIITMMVGVLFILAGCGSKDSNTSKSNNIVKDLNNIVNEETSKWKDRGYGATLSVYYIQNNIDKKDLGYIIVASGDEEFTSAPDFTKYKENQIPNYDGKSYSNMRMLEKDMKVNYFVVYEEKTEKYYNIEVNYEKVDLNGAKKEYPVFSNAKELK